MVCHAVVCVRISCIACVRCLEVFIFINVSDGCLRFSTVVYLLKHVNVLVSVWVPDSTRVSQVLISLKYCVDSSSGNLVCDGLELRTNKPDDFT